MYRSLFVLVTACGRIGFDRADHGGVTTDSATIPGDGSGSNPGDGPAMGDAAQIAGDTCATARTILIGNVLSGETIAGANNDYPALICGNGSEVVYRFTQPTNNANRQFDLLADFSGSVWLPDSCGPSGGSCQSFNANQQYTNMATIPIGTQYIVIDKVSGTGTTFALSVQ